MIIAGDFNIPVNNPNSSTAADFLDSINDIGFENKVRGRTFSRSENTLDLILDSYLKPIVKSVTIQSGYQDINISDHYLLTFEIDIPFVVTTKMKRIVFSNYNNDNNKAFVGFIMEHIHEIYDTHDFSDAIKALINLIIRGRELHLPLITKLIPDRPGRPWYSSVCRGLKRQLRRLQRLRKKILSRLLKRSQLSRRELLASQNSGTLLDKSIRMAHNKYVNECRRAKRVYYENIFKDYVKDPATTYKNVAHLLGKTKDKTLPSLTNSDPLKFANEFLDYLINKIKEIRNEINSNPPEISLINNVKHFLSLAAIQAESVPTISRFRPINKIDMAQILHKFNVTNCPLDPIDFSKVKLDFLEEILIDIINYCFEEGTFPDSLKDGIIYPHFKGHGLDSEQFPNYRPIVHEPVIPKTLEKASLLQITEHLSSNKLFPKYQSAYRKYHSTETFLLHLYRFQVSFV